KVYFAYLFLEGPDGRILAQHDSGGVGQTARIVHRADKAGTYQIIATSQGGFRTGPFTLTIRVVRAAAAKGLSSGKRLPPWFNELDTDGDGQVALYEWLDAGRTRDEFLKYDLNGDGFIPQEEALRTAKDSSRLELANGRASYSGDAEDSPAAAYRGKRAYKALTVRLERGKTYHIEQV